MQKRCIFTQTCNFFPGTGTEGFEILIKYSHMNSGMSIADDFFKTGLSLPHLHDEKVLAGGHTLMQPYQLPIKSNDL